MYSAGTTKAARVVVKQYKFGEPFVCVCVCVCVRERERERERECARALCEEYNIMTYILFLVLCIHFC